MSSCARGVRVVLGARVGVTGGGDRCNHAASRCFDNDKDRHE